jgi:hypothetical protein
MKEVLEVGGRIYESGAVVRRRYGISGATQARWIERGLLPAPLLLGRRKYFEIVEVASRVARGEPSHDAQKKR